MTAAVDPIQASAAFFNPQSRAPNPDDLSALYTFLHQHPHGRTLLRHVASLTNVLPVFGVHREDVRKVPNADHYASLLADWANGGPSAPVSEARTGIIALPLLLILQLGEYLRYLDFHAISHADFIDQVRGAGGIQGCCGGEPPALSIACAKDEAQIMDNAAVLLRIVMGVGAYIEALDDWTSSESTILAIRLKYEGQAAELMEMFPHTYVSAITETRSLSFVGHAKSISALYDYCREHGLPADKMDVTGKAHNPENDHVVPEFMDILNRNPSMFQLPENSRLQVTVRSNRTGEALTDAGIMEDMIIMMLAACCDWYGLLFQVAIDLKASARPAHRLVIFGLNDSVPLSPFNKQRLKIAKFRANQLLVADPQPQVQAASISPLEFPESAIAVVGLSCRFPGANNIEELWELIAKGHDTHQEVPLERIDPSRSFRASQDEHMAKRKFFGNFLADIKRFDNAFFGINAKEAASLDPQQRMLLELSYEALESSGYLTSHQRSAEDPVACFIGGSLNEYVDNTASHAPSAYTATGTIRAFMCGRLSHYYGWTGPAEVIDTACSSSLVAIHRACRAIQAGECSMAVAGGVSALTTVGNFLDLGKAGFLSQTGQCKPFDASADGYCRSEGAGLVVLKKLTDAISAGDHIFGVIPSIATNQGGTSTTLTVPSSTALKSLYSGLFEKSGLKPSQVSYVETHGTGTQAGDPIEMESIRAVMGDSSRQTPVSIGSIKGNIGHCESAAGVAGLLKVLAMMKYGGIPPQASHNRLNPKIPALEPDGMEINRQLRDWNVPQRAALVNSYGAGGSNCALLCCELSPRDGAARLDHSSPSSLRDRKVSLPVIVSAASRTSLVSHARELAAYLAKNASQLDVAGVAFTLNQRRKRNRFCFDTSSADLPGLIRALNQAEAPRFEYPRQHNPVVLVLSGQYDNKVALDRGIYEAYPAFRSYIDACNAALVKLGYHSIEAAIFQKTPISSAVDLQCSIFAVQYACARCWIDGGLKPDAILGHSLGEIVALAVSGALSVSDCLKLIAYRAQLIDTQWETDRGAMLAVHTSPSEVQKLITRLSGVQKSAKLEMACYNSPTSIVTAGAAATVDLAEQLLFTEKEFSGIKYQRLSTTHAFHSHLVESIMPELDQLCRSLTWNEPSIRLEGLKSIQDWNAARHARDPVYFVNAVQRVEQQLGSCIWLEAGMNSPIIPMTRRAMKDVNAHTLHPISIKQSEGPEACIAAVVSDFWRLGLSVSHWSFLGAGRAEFKEAWLPPYHFERNQYWVENVDRYMEMHERLLTSSTEPISSSPVVTPPTRLVSRKDASSRDPRIVSFAINTTCERFQEVVSGHAVLKQPLCPAPMYLESVTNAIQLLIGDVATQHLSFDELQFQSPLGLDPSREVELQLEELVPKQSWRFIVRSTTPSSTESLTHCIGMAAMPAQVSLSTYGRLVDGAITRLHNCDSAERFMAQRAYGLFTKVMHYAPFFKGIRSMAVDGDEAIATIKLPEGQPGRKESPTWTRCDAVLIDAFISVVGLLLNSSETAADGQILIAVGIERVVMTTACQADTQRDWSVYTKFMSTDDTQLMGDVFVRSPDNQVVAMMSGVQFSKLDMVKLTRFLGAANASLSQPQQVSLSEQKHVQRATTAITAPVADLPVTNGSATTSVTASTAILTPPEEDHESPDTVIKELISNYTGLDPADILTDAALVDLGIDSLSLIEFSEELNAAFGSDISTVGLGQMSVDDLSVVLVKKSPSEPRLTNGTNGVMHHDDPVPSMGSGSPGPLQSKLNGVAEQEDKQTASTWNPLEALLETDRHFQDAANRRGYVDYESGVLPLQDLLVQAYTLESFQAMGVAVLSYSPGSVIPRIPHIPKHEKLVSRLWEILQTHGVVYKQASIIVRGRQTPQIRSAAEVYEEFTSRFPAYLPEAKLMKLTGENLARVLKGEQDPLLLMFGSSASSKIMEDYYANSPMVSTLTDQLVTLVMTLLRGHQAQAKNNHQPPRILEVGAGTGGTTLRLAQAIEAAGISCQYTFTDISARFVTKAKEKLGRFSWINYDTFDIEKEAQPGLRNRFDILIGTNCVHATSSRVESCRRIGDCLTEEGVAILSEGTHPLAWFDMTFGLLDGWWVAENGTEYPLQPASKWMEAFQDAGFPCSGFSQGPGSEAFLQQLLVGSKKAWSESLTSKQTPSASVESESHRLETVVYKEVSGVQIHADVYVPRVGQTSPLAIALMIHGGGFMMLSRKAIRPAQTKHLLSAGFLPVSIDYRLCPEVNIIDGPMADARDAYWWARTQLPSQLRKYGITVDSSRVVVVGWSTGGHLAMSVGWTTLEAGMPPPDAILSFYAPIDFQSIELDSHARKSAPQPLQNRETILKNLGRTPITNYQPANCSEDNGFFGLQPGDPRSNLVLSVSKNGTALPLLLNAQMGSADYLEMPSASRIAAISPLAQVREGNYRTPTFIIHSRQDQVAPFRAAERFIADLKARGVAGGLLGLQSVPHLHDLYVRPGTREWEQQVGPGYRFLQQMVGI
ncbi:BcPKS16, polyketide synthase [Aspergillus sclerotiicarbonarius CBS 121057]|uniref:BcPKS16, polyketide synthase n=1 Tax=Aspergillus sclerotiicarbonarius (strain CBS 121057 / IBT 28362) TaxID=1448318 RepID=A0A319EXC8_ASPSB|nr:BcPKS16, polyketide synthase [Aspergillus sclerotiicarbonarius CBS 121057]